MQTFDPYGLEYRRDANIALDNLRHQGYPYPSQDQLNSEIAQVQSQETEDALKAKVQRFDAALQRIVERQDRLEARFDALLRTMNR
jgi:hypothetical protein